MILTIPFEEWEKASDATLFLDEDQLKPGAFVHLTVRDGRRVWMSTNGTSLFCLTGGEEVQKISLNLPGGLWNLLRQHVISDEVVRIEFADDDGVIKVSCDLVSYTFGAFRNNHPATTESWLQADNSTSAWIDGSLFHRVIMARAIAPIDGEKKPLKILFSLGNNSIELETTFNRTGLNVIGVQARTEGPDVMTGLMSKFLVSVAETIEPGDECKIRLPHELDRPVVFEHGDVTVMVMPELLEFQISKVHVEKIIKNALGALAVLNDQDGDYPLRRHGLPIFGRLVDERMDPSIFQVFAVVIDEIEETPELLREINSLNASMNYGRIMHVRNQVLAEIDLVAGSLTDVELWTAIERIEDFASTIAPTLQIVHYGKLRPPPEELRWAYYRQTRVQAEISPQQFAFLNGPDAIAEWPFPGPVYVLTGWNPQGTNRPGDFTNSRIAADIVRADGRFVMGRGAAIEGDYSEPSLIAWNISLDEARTVGRIAGQDAIFMIDADDLHLVSCDNDRSESWPRLAIPEDPALS